jgi:hypothetical protein
MYVVAVAPTIGSQPSPALPHLSHWYASASGGVPDQVPSVVDNVCPSIAVPEIAGGVVAVGGAAATTVVGAELVAEEPAELVAVTTTRMLQPTSSWVSAYVGFLAPVIGLHVVPAHRRH